MSNQYVYFIDHIHERIELAATAAMKLYNEQKIFQWRWRLERKIHVYSLYCFHPSDYFITNKINNEAKKSWPMAWQTNKQWNISENPTNHIHTFHTQIDIERSNFSAINI